MFLIYAAYGIFSMINTICGIYSKIPPDDEWLIYSKHVADDFCFPGVTTIVAVFSTAL